MWISAHFNYDEMYSYGWTTYHAVHELPSMKAKLRFSDKAFGVRFPIFNSAKSFKKRYEVKSNILAKYKGTLKHSKTRQRKLAVHVIQGKDGKGKYHAVRL